MPKVAKKLRAKKVKKVKRAVRIPATGHAAHAGMPEDVAAQVGQKVEQETGVTDVGQHLAMLTDLEMFSMDPGDALLSVEVTIGERKFKQAMDEVYALKWDNARQRFSPAEIAKHISRCSFYAATFLIAATEASAEYERLENFFNVWKAEQSTAAEERIKEQRIEEMSATDDRPKLRTQIGQITQAQVEAEICAEETRKGQFLGWQKRMRESKKNRDMMKGLYQICTNAGSYLQTLSRMYNVEEMVGRG